MGSGYEYLSFSEAGQQAADIAGAMAHVGIAPHDRASVFGANCPEWMLVMQVGCWEAALSCLYCQSR